MKTAMTNNRQQQMGYFCFGRIRLLDTCESALTIFDSAMRPVHEDQMMPTGKLYTLKIADIGFGQSDFVKHDC